jgi:hypothetical protein
MAAPLQVGSTAVIYYAKGDNTQGELEGTVVTLATQYLEISTGSGLDICIGWARVNEVLVS